MDEKWTVQEQLSLALDLMTEDQVAQFTRIIDGEEKWVGRPYGRD